MTQESSFEQRRTWRRGTGPGCWVCRSLWPHWDGWPLALGVRPMEEVAPKSLPPFSTDWRGPEVSPGLRLLLNPVSCTPTEKTKNKISSMQTAKEKYVNPPLFNRYLKSIRNILIVFTQPPAITSCWNVLANQEHLYQAPVCSGNQLTGPK